MTKPELNGSFFNSKEPVALWSGRLALSLPIDEFEATIGEAAKATQQGYTGFITTEGDTVTSFTRTRYPRKKYGLLSVEECEQSTRELADMLSTEIEDDMTGNGMRVVLGLNEGYAEGAIKHDIGEVADALHDATVKPATVFAARPSGAEVSFYTEPVAVVRFKKDDISDVFQLGDKFKQERFTVEDGNWGMAFVVETQYCSEPD